MINYKDMTLWESVKYIPTRFVTLISKIIGIKGVVLAATFYVIKEGMIPEQAVGYVWIFVILIVVFGEKALTFLKDIKK